MTVLASSADVQHTFDELLRTPIHDYTKIIAIICIVLTVVLLIAVAVVRDFGVFSRLHDERVYTVRAKLLRKYLSTNSPAGVGRTADGLRASPRQYCIAEFSLRGKKDPLPLIVSSEKWERLPEKVSGVLVYSGVILREFTPDGEEK